MKKLPEKLLTLRKSRSLSQEDMAAQLNVTRQAISRWENGTAVPDAYNLLQISKLFQVSADYLLNDDYTDPDPQPISQPEPKGKNPAPFCLILAVLAYFTHYLPNPFTGIFAALFGAFPLTCVILGFALAARKHHFPKNIRLQFCLPACLLASFFVIVLFIHILILLRPDIQTTCFFLILQLITLYNYIAAAVFLFALYAHFREILSKKPS